MGFVDQKSYNNNLNQAAMLTFTSAMVTASPVKFYAFITSYTENYASDWNIQAVYGRTDPIANFRGNTRTLTLAWDIPAGTLEEAKENLQNFNELNKMIYPFYSKPQGVAKKVDSKGAAAGELTTYSSNALSLAKSPLIRLKFSNLIQAGNGKTNGLLGYITSLSWNPVIEMGMFTDAGQLYPKVVSLNVNFGVLHEYDRGFFAAPKTNKEGTPATDNSEATSFANGLGEGTNGTGDGGTPEGNGG